MRIPCQVMKIMSPTNNLKSNIVLRVQYSKLSYSYRHLWQKNAIHRKSLWTQNQEVSCDGFPTKCISSRIFTWIVQINQNMWVKSRGYSYCFREFDLGDTEMAPAIGNPDIKVHKILRDDYFARIVPFTFSY